MDIGYLWDQDKYLRVVKSHDVRFSEVVSAFEDLYGFETLDPGDNNNRWIWVGMSNQQRMLNIVYSDEEIPVLRLITAFAAERRFIDEYNDRKRI